MAVLISKIFMITMFIFYVSVKVGQLRGWMGRWESNRQAIIAANMAQKKAQEDALKAPLETEEGPELPYWVIDKERYMEVCKDFD